MVANFGQCRYIFNQVNSNHLFSGYPGLGSRKHIFFALTLQRTHTANPAVGLEGSRRAHKFTCKAGSTSYAFYAHGGLQSSRQPETKAGCLPEEKLCPHKAKTGSQRLPSTEGWATTPEQAHPRMNKAATSIYPPLGDSSNAKALPQTKKHQTMTQ